MRAADDGGMSARCNVVAGYIAVSVHPLVDVKCGITVKLLNLICLVEGILEKFKFKNVIPCEELT